MNTVANVRKSEGSHWYYPDARPCYELPKKSGKGMKKPTLADAKELNLIPSVTTILKCLHKPNLQDWLIEQAVLAVITTPRKTGERDDEFINRVLYIERIQDQEADEAAGRGSAIHDAIDKAIKGEQFDPAYVDYVKAVFPILEGLGKVQWSEKILVGDGYAGRSDILLGNDSSLFLLDFKSTKKVPKESYKEHKLQTSAYAATLKVADRHVLTGNLYLSTVNPGEVCLSIQEEWRETYTNGFMPLLKYWQWANNYKP